MKQQQATKSPKKKLIEAKKINLNDVATCHSSLGYLLYRLKLYEDAERELREAVRLNPNLAEAHNNLGLLLVDLKRYNEALNEFLKAKNF